MIIRTFIALEISNVIRNQITNIQKHLMNKGAELRWIKNDNIHLTLRFLGEIDNKNHDKIFEAMNNAAEDTRSLNLSLTGLGMFPDENHPTVIWVGIGGEVEELRQMAEKCDYYLTVKGFEIKKRHFRPHITIGRIKKITDKNLFISELKDVEINRADFKVDRLNVVKSDLKPTGAIYTNLHTVHFYN